MMSHGDMGNRSQKMTRSDEEREAWNRYMRNFRRGFKERGLTSLSTVITSEQAEFIERYARIRSCQSKREALMMIIEEVRERFDAESGDSDPT